MPPWRRGGPKRRRGLISGSGGIGRLVAEAMLSGDPSPYVKSLSPDRFTESHWSWEEARRRARKVYESYHALESC